MIPPISMSSWRSGHCPISTRDRTAFAASTGEVESGTGMKQIRCIGMSQDEVDAAVEICGKRPSFGQSGYSVTGLADDAEIRQLEQAGLLVEVIPDETLPIAWLEPDPAEAVERRGPPPMADAAERPFSGLATDGAGRYVVQFSGPLGEDDRATLSDLGVELGTYVPDFAYKATLSAEQKEAVEALGFVRRVVHFGPSLTLRRTRIIRQVDAALGEPEPVADVEEPAPEFRERGVGEAAGPVETEVGFEQPSELM